MYLLQSLIIIFSFLPAVKAACIHVITTDYASSNATCERDNVTLHPCVGLADLERTLHELDQTDINITLLPGDYHIFDMFSFQFYDGNVYLTSSQNQGQVRLICNGGDFSMKFTRTETLGIRNVEFLNCGYAAPIIRAHKVTYVNILYINCTNSSEGFLEVNRWHRGISISHCIFQGSINHFAVKVATSTSLVKVFIFDTVFANNTFSSLMLFNIVKCVITIDQCTFENNKAGKDSNGAAIVTEKYMSIIGEHSSLFIHHCHFLNNTAGDGGAVVITDYCISISHSRFTNNSAQKRGGAIKLSTLLHKVDMHNCTFIHNHAQNGGVIFITLKNCEVYGLLLFSVVNSEFVNNSAVDNGGVLKAEAMYSPTRDKTISIENVTLDSNPANTGGALYMSKAQNIEILNCILTNNHGNHASDSTKGGAVAIINSVVSIKKTLFVNNKAQIGGALWIYKATSFNMKIYTTITIHHMTFQDNEAESGGALYLNNSAVNLSSGFYISNTACTGGAIFSEKSYLHIGTVYLADKKALSASKNSYSMKGTSE